MAEIQNQPASPEVLSDMLLSLMGVVEGHQRAIKSFLLMIKERDALIDRLRDTGDDHHLHADMIDKFREKHPRLHGKAPT